VSPSLHAQRWEETVSLTALAVSAHLFATVVLVGYYTVLALIVAPAVVTVAGGTRPIEVLAAVERRAMPLLIASLVAFLATGVYLLTADPQYAGPGKVGGAWATLLLIKHVVVVVMLILGSYLDGLIVRATDTSAGRDGMPRVLWASRGMAFLGGVVLLLTAAAQTS
jgi:uncharacterized membrane protein